MNGKCSHLDNVVQLSLSDLCKKKQGEACFDCSATGPNLWICLNKNCLHIGCSEQYNDHSTSHFKANNLHCVHMNLSSQRIWCYVDEMEVFLNSYPHQRRTSIISNDSSDTSREKIHYDKGDSADSSGEEEDSDRHGKWNGLVGLQNIANTCYMNAAIQALSNTPPLTGYFLDCSSIIEHDLMNNQSNAFRVPVRMPVNNPGLAKNYHRLIREMWCKNKRYVIPSGILYGIRIVHPMFRGFQQHDTQEFLRCFMDQLHEELKDTNRPMPPNNSSIKEVKTNHTQDEDISPCPSPSPSQSDEAEYETCDSGVSEQSSLSDETAVNRKRSHMSRSPSPSPTASQRNNFTIKQAPSSSSNANNQNTNQKSSKDKQFQRSIISDIFDGKLLSSVQCLTCDRISTREETFQDLSLPIPGKDHLAVLHQSHQGLQHQTQQQQQQPNANASCNDVYKAADSDSWFWSTVKWIMSWFWGPPVSLYDCLAAFFSADELKGDNMYSCEKCNKLRNGVKYSKVLALPEMLCVHLKRFRHDLSYSSKISSPVLFPLTGLDMRQYLHKDCKSEITSYDLCAIICHHGTVGSGHYTAFAKHDPTGKWFEFDDQLVTQVQPEDVQNCEAYVLFYRKNNTKMNPIRSKALDLINMQDHPSDIRFYISKNWLHRFNTFAEPGPIDNWTLLCPHGGLPPNKASSFFKLVVPIPQPLWDFLYKKFGGGPACNALFPCDICKKAAETLSRRQQNELEQFTRLNDDFQCTEVHQAIYAISMAWLRKWQLFARGHTNEEPGPIDNKSIVICNEVKMLRQGSDCAQINATLWRFFHGLYGGGPEFILRGAPLPLPAESPKIKERDVDIGEDIKDKDQPTENHQQKPQKSVSFEDNEAEEKEKTIEFVIPSYKRSKYNQPPIRQNAVSQSPPPQRSLSPVQPPIVMPLEIGGKKNRRNRTNMKSTGLFGADGKYSEYIPQNDAAKTEIPRTNSFSQHSNTSKVNTLNSSSSVPTFQRIASESVSNDSGVVEIVPLLHQASISNDLEQLDDSQEVNDKSLKHKTSYRKKIKSKFPKKEKASFNGTTRSFNLSSLDHQSDGEK